MNNNKATANPETVELLPDFCANQSVLTAMLIGELLAIILALSAGHRDLQAISFLAYASLFIQWITLTDIAVLCWGKRGFALLPPRAMMLAVYISLQLVTLLISELGYQAVSHLGISTGGDATLHSRLLLSNLAISMIITAVAMRYFYLQHQNAQRLQAQTQAKIEALQARIRPHFLFNSMNTIANLIHSDPAKAEDAVLDLSELFRSSLTKRDFVSLDEEIQITRRYINIESLRLGARLQLDWQIPQPLPALQMPALMLQPLVENAIYHGIEPLPEGGKIQVAIHVEARAVHLVIRNPVPSSVANNRRKGNQMALRNTRQRLALAYGGAGQLRIEHSSDQHTVELTIPREHDHENSDS